MPRGQNPPLEKPRPVSRTQKDKDILSVGKGMRVREGMGKQAFFSEGTACAKAQGPEYVRQVCKESGVAKALA